MGRYSFVIVALLLADYSEGLNVNPQRILENDQQTSGRSSGNSDVNFGKRNMWPVKPTEGNTDSDFSTENSGSNRFIDFELPFFPMSPRDSSFSTVTSTTTKSHLIRVTTTSNVWVTTAVVVPRVVTQYKTSYSFVPEFPQTVTSVVRVTRTPFSVVTRTVESVIVRTDISGFTNYSTVTRTVDFWHPVTHYATTFEIVSRPVFETQTLLQVITTTATIRTTRTITVTRTPVYNYGY